MGLTETFAFFILSCAVVASVPVIPRPALNVENVTSYSITINWTLPKNELFSEFVVEIIPEEGDVMDYNQKDMKRTFVNLTPGVLYTFIVRTVREETFSDPSEIKQDTVPLSPTGLQLLSFDTLVLTLEGPYFQDAQFTVNTHGVEAVWNEPTSGISECYNAEIEDTDGLQAIPGVKDEVLRGDQMRQFINLIPGKTYTVTVYSVTCGEGHLGQLRSDGVSAKIRLPPDTPPAIIVKESVTTAELKFEKEPAGFYDDFEIVQVGEMTSRITVDEPITSTDLIRNLSGLLPCHKYEVDVYTVLEGTRSLTPRRVVINTKPEIPSGLVIRDFSETTATLTWNVPLDGSTQGFLTAVSPDTQNFLAAEGTETSLDNLSPGTTYTLAVKSFCLREEEITSNLTTVTLTTKPNPPVVTRSECTYIGANESLASLYNLVPWEAPDPSRINLMWEKPNEGSMDRFLVDYSPYEFEHGQSTPTAPMLFDAEKVSTQISIPISGRVMTVSVRTISNNVPSEPAVSQIVCGGPDGESSLRCRSYLVYWTILITPLENATRLLVEIPDFPIYNATVYMDDRNEVLLFYNNTFIIRNPCAKGSKSRITVHPRCPDVLPFCPVITRRICGHLRGREDFVIPNACCNSRLYNTDDEICCHNKLLKKSDRTIEQCCATKWYDLRTQKCCMNGYSVIPNTLKNSSC